MEKDIRNIEPSAVWNHFADLNSIPRPSKKEEKVIQFMLDFGNRLKLKTFTDSIGNVIIKKPATQDMKDRKTIILQGHLDMVHQKNAETEFDFENEGIKMFVDGDWVKAKGTTLGADNGLGVAAIMAVLSSNTISHPSIEALFTIDEETGMTGAKELSEDILEGEILLNLDTEEDDEIGIGCAGGIDITAKKSYTPIKTSQNDKAYLLSVTGLNGGHSGMDIIKGLGNANKIMNRILYAVSDKIEISEVDGGSLRNAIPRENFTKIIIDKNAANVVEKDILTEFSKIFSEYKNIEANLNFEIKEIETPNFKMNNSDSIKFIRSIYSALNGVYKMSSDVKDLVETSNNIARIKLNNGEIEIGCLTRSSSETSKIDLANSLKSSFELADFKVDLSGDYPGWLPDINSSILKVVESSYKKLFHQNPRVAACHAGLECGILGEKYPNVEMISFGPNIKGAHSPDEKAQISSSQKFWKLLLEILKNIPPKDR